MVKQPQFDYLIVSDSDIKVPPDYLRRVLAPFADQRLGMVTCLYRGIPGGTLGSHLEAIGINTDFAASVLAARVVQGVKFGFGSTEVFRREDLERIGGFDSLLDYLADDYQIGARIAALGKHVVISDLVVDHHLPDYTLSEFFHHQTRWARAIRDSRKLDYIGLAATFGVPWALLTVLFAQVGVWSLILLTATLAFRLAVAALMASEVLGQRLLLLDYCLIPVRDIAALVVWIASFAGNTIHWRGLRFRLKQGKLHPT
jgi:ceramide glucosyltransferase